MQGKDIYGFSRLMYIIEAALEYFVSIAVGTVYLARVTDYIGMSDALTAVLSSFVSLGCGFQLIAIFLANKHPVKGWVTVGHVASQILFALLYVVPLLDLTSAQRAVLFTVILLVAQIIHNVINSPKINWFMTLVDDKKRGKFTADKEIVSLIGGVVFSYCLGAVMDCYEAQGDMRGAFTVCGIGLFVLMLLHTATLLLSREKQAAVKAEPVAQNLKRLLKNKALFRIIAISVFWNVASYATVSFTGTYQAKELAFSATFSSVVIMVGSLIRAVASRPMGMFADRYSFRKMLSVCTVLQVLAFGINIFTAPENGKVLYLIHYVLYCVGMAGISSATINLIYDYVDHDQRTGALALQQTCAGFSGFFAVLLLSPLVDRIQADPVVLFGKTVYAQQFLSAFSCAVVLLMLLYLNTVIKKLKKVAPAVSGAEET